MNKSDVPSPSDKLITLRTLYYYRRLFLKRNGFLTTSFFDTIQFIEHDSPELSHIINLLYNS
jgi:hypothetical protein